MIEDHAILCFIAVIALPCIFGGIYALISRPSRHYYRNQRGVWYRKRY
ncbi:MAG: hypothetical protein IJW55_07390 [Clostridia bacterium]|nr:hypothetical protein [Clostridia bacterium]